MKNTVRLEWIAAASCLMVLGGCDCARGEGLIFACEPDGGCLQPGYICGEDFFCYGGMDGGSCGCVDLECTRATCLSDGGCSQAPRMGPCVGDAGGPHECINLVCRCSLDSPETNCSNGLDDDCNGFTDCSDPACANKECRASAGACDVFESCSDGGCPADRFVDAGASCRASSAVCDQVERCTGSASSCPGDVLVPADAGFVCRASVGSCDTAEVCSGADAGCPNDVQSCLATHFCAADAGCLPKFGNGTSCTEGIQCSSGFCADGFCCGTACVDSCETRL